MYNNDIINICINNVYNLYIYIIWVESSPQMQGHWCKQSYLPLTDTQNTCQTQSLC